VSSGNDQPAGRRGFEAAQTALLFALLYFFADFVLNQFIFSERRAILSPLNGVTIAVLLMRPRRIWPAMLLGIAVGTGIGECLSGGPVFQDIWERLFSLTEVLLSASLLPAFATLEQWLHKPFLFPRFFAALALGPGVSGILAAIFFSFFLHQRWLPILSHWAIPDALGIAAMMPLILSLPSQEMRSLFARPKLPQTLGIFVLVFASSVLIFYVSRFPLLFLMYPILLLVDSLLEFAGSSIAVVIVFLVSVYCTTHGHGPFNTWRENQILTRDTGLQIYLGFQMIALFPASILFMERRKMAEKLRDTNAQLVMLASLDGLTSIANRRSLDERFEQEWNRAVRVRTPLSLLMIDIDHFKQFNDMYGHQAGDQCLRSVAGVLTSRTRRPQDLVARFGGEEFVILLPHTPLEGACARAEEIRAAVVELGTEHADSPWGQLTISIGCAALTPTRGQDKSELLQLADAALYQAKQNGRNCIEIRFADNEAVR
jgi:diguanylate cyclase (GGDEF)-like protein